MVSNLVLKGLGFTVNAEMAALVVAYGGDW
jgi:hypothetical protein